MLIAHRGLYTSSIKENTIEAFDNALNNGYDGIELDVRLTKDKVPVVVHDSFLSRVFDKKGLVKDYNYNELKYLNIPTLEDVIKRYNNIIMIIELKESIDITKYLDNRNKYYISSFNYEYISKYKKSDNYKLGVINYVFNSVIDYSKLDFIMILDTIYNEKLFNFDNLEIIIYGVIGKINNYNKDIKYVI